MQRIVRKAVGKISIKNRMVIEFTEVSRQTRHRSATCCLVQPVSTDDSYTLIPVGLV